jgi:hypothetical protein
VGLLQRSASGDRNVHYYKNPLSERAELKPTDAS